MSGRIVTKPEVITPSIAKKYLALNRSNRSIRRQLVLQLADLMKHGKFYTSHQGIAFYDTGELADGQHRLSAIVESGVDAEMLVTRGLQPQANHCIDRGIARTARDSLGFLGVNASNRDCAILRCIIQQHDMIRDGRDYWSSKSIPSERFSENFFTFSECIEFSRGLSSCPAPCAAAFALAFFSESRDRLTEFASAFNRGFCERKETDMAAIAIRELVIAKKYSLGCNGRHELFIRSCTSIRNFCRFHSPSRLTACKSSSYTAPDGMVI